jgi:hypothetical protein
MIACLTSTPSGRKTQEYIQMHNKTMLQQINKSIKNEKKLGRFTVVLLCMPFENKNKIQPGACMLVFQASSVTDTVLNRIEDMEELFEENWKHTDAIQTLFAAGYDVKRLNDTEGGPTLAFYKKN